MRLRSCLRPTGCCGKPLISAPTFATPIMSPYAYPEGGRVTRDPFDPAPRDPYDA